MTAPTRRHLLDPSVIGLFAASDARVRLAGDLGLKVAPSVEALGAQTEGYYTELAAENADRLSDVDILVVDVGGTPLATLQADPLLGKIPAVARGSVVEVPSGPFATATAVPNLLSVEWALGRYLDLLQSAADRIA